MRDGVWSDKARVRFSALTQGLDAPGEAQATLDVNAQDPVERIDVLSDQGTLPIGEQPVDINAHHVRHQHGGADEVAAETPAAYAIPKADGAGTLSAWTASPLAHASRHATGQSDALAASDIGAVPATRTVSAGSGLTGGGDLSDDRSVAIDYAAAHVFSGQVTGAQYFATATLSSDQSVNNGVVSTIDWTSTTLVGITHASGTFTLPADGAGYYLICGQVEFDPDADGIRAASIYKGATLLGVYSVKPDAAAQISAVFCYMGQFANNDTILIKAYHTAGNALNVNSGAGRTQVQIRRLV